MTIQKTVTNRQWLATLGNQQVAIAITLKISELESENDDIDDIMDKTTFIQVDFESWLESDYDKDWLSF